MDGRRKRKSAVLHTAPPKGFKRRKVATSYPSVPASNAPRTAHEMYVASILEEDVALKLFQQSSAKIVEYAQFLKKVIEDEQGITNRQRLEAETVLKPFLPFIHMGAPEAPDSAWRAAIANKFPSSWISGQPPLQLKAKKVEKAVRRMYALQCSQGATKLSLCAEEEFHAGHKAAFVKSSTIIIDAVTGLSRNLQLLKDKRVVGSESSQEVRQEIVNLELVLSMLHGFVCCPPMQPSPTWISVLRYPFKFPALEAHVQDMGIGDTLRILEKRRVESLSVSLSLCAKQYRQRLPCPSSFGRYWSLYQPCSIALRSNGAGSAIPSPPLQLLDPAFEIFSSIAKKPVEALDKEDGDYRRAKDMADGLDCVLRSTYMKSLHDGGKDVAETGHSRRVKDTVKVLRRGFESRGMDLRTEYMDQAEDPSGKKVTGRLDIALVDDYCLAAVEVKTNKEPTDPSMQAGGCYGIVSKAQGEAARRLPGSPCLILCIEGRTIFVHGVFDDGGPPIIDNLATYTANNSDLAHEELARILYASIEFVENLKALVNSQRPVSNDSAGIVKGCPRLLSRFNAMQDPSDTKESFVVYEKPLICPGRAGQYIYLAHLGQCWNERRVVEIFSTDMQLTGRRRVHLGLAELGLAPRLYAECVSGPFSAFSMEYLEPPGIAKSGYTSLEDLANVLLGRKSSPKYRKLIEAGMRGLLEKLKSNDFVHGQLIPCNIFIQMKSQKRVMKTASGSVSLKVQNLRLAGLIIENDPKRPRHPYDRPSQWPGISGEPIAHEDEVKLVNLWMAEYPIIRESFQARCN